MVGFVISKAEVIQRYVFNDETVTGESCKRTLRYHLSPKLTDLHLDMILNKIGRFLTMRFWSDNMWTSDLQIRGWGAVDRILGVHVLLI